MKQKSYYRGWFTLSTVFWLVKARVPDSVFTYPEIGVTVPGTDNMSAASQRRSVYFSSNARDSFWFRITCVGQALTLHERY